VRLHAISVFSDTSNLPPYDEVSHVDGEDYVILIWWSEKREGDFSCGVHYSLARLLNSFTRITG